MAAALPSEFRLIPARAGLNAVADPQRRNLQAGTAILNLKRFISQMTRAFLLITALSAALIFGACSSSNSNTNANHAGNGNVNVDANHLPEGLSTSPVPPSTNTTPGIPAPGEANNLPKGTTPTPGIPSAEELRKPMKPGATPTPGIPSPEELRKQMQRQSNVNTVTSDDSQMMMKKKPANKPQ